MIEKLAGLFRRKSDVQRLEEEINAEIYGRLFSHLNIDKDHGYPFVTNSELVAHTEALNIQSEFERAERQIDDLPEAYGRCFRYAMRRDICEKLRAYALVANRRKEPNVYWRPATMNA